MKSSKPLGKAIYYRISTKNGQVNKKVPQRGNNIPTTWQHYSRIQATFLIILDSGILAEH